MTFKLPLPCTAIDIENFIHNHCNEHGFPNCIVTSDGGSLILTFEEFGPAHYAPKIPGASSTGPTHVRC